MGARRNPIDEAARRGRRHLELVLDDLRNARRAAGLSQRAVAEALGCSRQEIGAAEGRELRDIGVIQLVRHGAVVGLDVSVRTFAAGSPLRDAGQLSLLARFRTAIGDAMAWRTEVPVSQDPRDRRAFDAVLSRGQTRVAVEAITRLTDAQAQVRSILLKEEAAHLGCVVLVLADTMANRRAVRDAATTFTPAFPIPPRSTLSSLRVGEAPKGNGHVFV